MSVHVLTIDDLQVFKVELLSNLREMLSCSLEPNNELLKNKDVRAMLGISAATLQTLRINGTLPYSKIGGTLYYKRSDVLQVFNDNLRQR